MSRDTDNQTPKVANQASTNSDDSPADAPSKQQDEAALLETARRFLESDLVKDATRESKIEFLRTKNLNEEQMEALLANDENKAVVSQPAEVQGSEHETVAQCESDAKTEPDSTPSNGDADQSPDQSPDTVPVITYPEFLAPPAPPRGPLVSTETLLNTLYAFTGLSTLVYGTSKYAIQPMVAATTDARIDLHKTTSRNLDDLVRLLEKTVSRVPEDAATTGPGVASDAMSEVDDPAELFSRDMGTQTSTPVARSPVTGAMGGSTPSLGARLNTAESTALVSMEPVVQTQLKKIARVAEMSEDLAELGDQDTGMARDLWQEMTDFEQRISSIQSSLDNGLGIHGQYGYTVGIKNEKDETQLARDNIRKLKGILLSSRNFPMATR